MVISKVTRTLGDGSKVFDVTVAHGSELITFNAFTEFHADGLIVRLAHLLRGNTVNEPEVRS